MSGSLEELSSPPRLQQDSADEKQDNPVTDLQPPPQSTTRTITISPVVQEIEGTKDTGYCFHGYCFHGYCFQRLLNYD